MQSPGHLVRALILLGTGIALLYAWRQIYEGAHKSHALFTESLGLPFGSERFYRALTRFVVVAISIGCFLGAVGDLEHAFTGHESRLRTAQWRDLWPF